MALGPLAISTYMVAAALKWPLKTKLFPMAIGIPVFLLALAELVMTVRERQADSAASAPAGGGTVAPATEEPLPLGKLLLGFSFAIGFFLLILLFSFPIAIPLFVFLYMKVYGKEKWATTLAATAVAWAAFYGLFVVVLHTLFAKGLVQVALKSLGVL
jgi:hypothetical protein